MQTTNETQNQTVTKFENAMSTALLVVLSFFTLGLMGYLRVYQMNKDIQLTTKQQTSNDGYILTVGLLLGLSFLFLQLDLWATNLSVDLLVDSRDWEGAENVRYLAIFFSVVSSLLSLAATILYIIWAFKIKAILVEYARQHNMHLTANGFFAFIFNYFYINYKLNEFNHQLLMRGYGNGQQ